MTDLFDLWKEKSELEEGKVTDHVYLCTAGKKTTGCGFNIEDNPIPVQILEYWINAHGLPEDVYSMWLRYEFNKLNNALITKTWFNRLDVNRKLVILDMSHNMGVSGCLKFVNMINAAREERWDLAADEILNSAYARGPTRNRARRNAEIMRTGEL